jgi:hypothetical protein
MAKYEKVIPIVKEILETYDMKLTLRQIYYRLVAKEVIPNKVSEYKSLSANLVKARKNGDIKTDAIEDKTRTSKVTHSYCNNPEFTLKWNFKYFHKSMKGYTIDKWYKQKSKVFVVLEKQALESVFSQICNKLGVTLIVNRGYNSFTQLSELAEKMKSNNGNLPRYFLMFGDFDPTGHDIIRNFQDQLRELDISGEYFDIAINKQQIDEYNLPPQPVKTTDSRTKKWSEEHGSGVVELDALEPPVLQEMVNDAILQYYDNDIYQEVLVLQGKHREYFNSVVDSLQESFTEILAELEEDEEEDYSEDPNPL